MPDRQNRRAALQYVTFDTLHGSDFSSSCPERSVSLSFPSLYAVYLYGLTENFVYQFGKNLLAARHSQNNARNETTYFLLVDFSGQGETLYSQ